jgi:hypothetical protein
MMKDIQVKITPHDHRVTFDYTFEIAYREIEGMYDCIIPAFNMSFSCPTEEDITRTAGAMMDSMFYFWMKDGKDTLKTVALELHKRGFRAHNHNLTMKEIVNNKRFKANFSPSNIHRLPEFENAALLTENAQLTVAA